MFSIFITDLIILTGVTTNEEYLTTGFTLVINRAINSFGCRSWFFIAIFSSLFDFAILIARYVHNRSLER